MKGILLYHDQAELREGGKFWRRHFLKQLGKQNYGKSGLLVKGILLHHQVAPSSNFEGGGDWFGCVGCGAQGISLRGKAESFEMF